MQGEERESCEHIHFAKYHPQEQIMLFKMCLRMKYVLQDHNQSLNVPHLEIQVNRTMLQKLPTNTVCNKQDHKDLWACKTGHNMFLEFLPSMSWWHLTPNRGVRCCTTSILSLKTMSTMQQGNALHQLAFFPFSCTKPGKNQQTAPPRILLGIHHFHTLLMRLQNLSSTQLLKVNGQVHID